MPNVPPPPPRPTPKRKSFRPSARGSLVDIASNPAKIEIVRPESPRPAELLKGIRAEGDVSLTGLDVAVWEMVLSWAYEMDPGMTSTSYRIPAPALRRYLGEFVKRSEVEVSLEKMSNIKLSFGDYESTLYSGVQMITAWDEQKEGQSFIGFQFADPLRRLMSTMREYAHIELAAICAKKSSKHATPLYKYLALEASRHRWTPGEDNSVAVSLTAEELADIVDFPRDKSGKINVGKLTQLVLGHHEDYDLVRKFKASGRVIYAPARGKPVDHYEFDIRLMPPSPQHISARYRRADLVLGGVDDAKYQVRSDLWLRAHRAFGKVAAFEGYLHRDFFTLWTVALKEALDAKALTPGFSAHQYRGDSLLVAIEQEGADYAAWGLITEEVENPDLVRFLRETSIGQKGLLVALADADRRERVGWKADRKRKHATRYFGKQIDAEKAISPEHREEINESVIVKDYDDSTLGYEFEPWPSSSFDTCSSVQLTMEHMSIETLEEQVIPLIASGSGTGDGREIDVVLAYEDPDTKSTEFFERKITVTSDEWAAILVQMQPHIIGQEMYDV